MKIKTEKIVKPLKKIKAQEKQNEIDAQMVKPAVRIQELKNKLIKTNKIWQEILLIS